MTAHHNETALADGWRFQFEHEEPHPVMLPHSWNALDTMSTDPAHYYRRGQGTYTRDFVPPPNSEGKRLWLRFGAVAQRGYVYFDDELIGEHHGGYTAFTVEVPNRAGVLRVVADNMPDPDLIPSDMSDFYLYGGITRPVTLYATHETRLERVLFDIDTHEEAAQVSVRGRLADELAKPMRLAIILTAPGDDTPFYREQRPISGKTFAFRLPDVPNPHLWSPQNPQLYRVEVRLLDGQRTLDTYSTSIGFRWFDFPDGGPFYLNGERLLLRGTHRHDDWAGHGAAVPPQLIRQEMEQIKAAGFNFIRLGHYPQDDDTLHLCDTLGLIVWEELPWCRGGVGGDVFRSHARQMLTEMIEQHYNSPSVIFWGLGNELDWESEHPGSSDEKVAAFLRELHEQSHELDPRRLTALRRFEQGAAIVDVYSPSIWSGWYRGRYQDYEIVLQQAMERYPRLLHIEWGGDSHIGRHNNGPHIQAEVTSGYDHGEVPGTATSQEGFTRYSRDGDWSESYIMDLMAHHLSVHARLPHLAGTAQWVFKDFGTPLRPENPIPYVNQKGLVARDGTPKDAYHVFRAFQTSEPIVYIESWPLRVADEQHTVRVVTNCEQVELRVDGRSQGTQQRQNAPADILTWQVVLPPGEHTLEAVGDARHCVECIAAVGNCNPVAGVQVTPYQECLSLQLMDADGHPVTTDERRVRFSIIEGGQLARWQGTMGGSDVIQTANGRAWVRLLPDSGSMRIKIEVEGLEPEVIYVDT